MTIRVMIVDDEEFARRGVRTRLQRLNDVEIVAECKNGREAIESIRVTSPDLVFLDVQMPGKNGFDVLEDIGQHSLPYIIFLTAHDKYATRAFDVRALDYLLKPIDDERFHIALSRARASLTRDRDDHLGRRLMALVEDIRAAARTPKLPEKHRIMVRSGGRVMFVKVDDIDWIEAAGDYVSIHSGKKSWLLRETISELERRLAPHGFARIHRSTLVKLERISELRAVDNGEYVVLLNDGTPLKLSRNYRQAIEPLMKHP